MYNWRKWIWPGVLTIVILTALAVWFRVGPVQDDLSAKALNDLSQTHSWAGISLDGRDLTLTGTAPSPEAAADALKIADDAYDVRIAIDQTNLPPVAQPFEFGVEKGAGGYTVSGNVPGEEARAQLLGAVTAIAEGAAVTDQTTIARGAAGTFIPLATFAIQQLTELEDGKFGISDNQLSIAGRASGLDQYDAVTGNLAASMPAGTQIAEQNILPPVVEPYTWAADYGPEGVTLSGFAPNEDAKAAIEAGIVAQLPGVTVTNELRVADGAPAEFKTATDYASGFFPLLTNGQVRIERNSLFTSGVAKTPEAYGQALDRTETLPEGYQLAENSIQPRGVSPYAWSAMREGSSLIIDGYVPSRKARREIATAARTAFPQAGIVDELEIAGGAPSGFAGIVDFSLEALKQLPDGAASLADQTLSITGTAATAEAYATVNQLLDGGVDGVSITRDIRPPRASPYRWSIANVPDGLTLRGNVSDETERSAIIDSTINTFGRQVVDRMTVASGAPASIGEARALLTGLVARLDAGQGNLMDQTISVSGKASSEAVADEINAALKEGAPAGFNVSSNIRWTEEPGKPEVEQEPIVELPVANPYRWSISRLPDGITILGNATSIEDANSTANVIAQRFSGSSVDDRQVPASGAPQGFAAVKDLLIAQVAQLEAGQGNLVGKKVSVTGRATSEEIRNLINDAITGTLPAGFTGSTSIVFPEAKVEEAPKIEESAELCQAGIAQAIDGRTIQFETARAIILPDSGPVLNAVLDAASKCPALKMLVSGHTDSRGRDDYNQQLSEARAASVVRYLVENGLDENRLEAKGFGEAVPIATNETAEGRAQNRRIEFTVLEGGTSQ